MTVVACDRIQCCDGGGPSAHDWRIRIAHPRGTCPHPAGDRWSGLTTEARREACAACEHAVRGATLVGDAARREQRGGLMPTPAAAIGATSGPGSDLLRRLMERVRVCRGCERWDDSAGADLSECELLAPGELRSRWSRPSAACPQGHWGAIEVTA